MSQHKHALRAYIMNVTQDLLRRGAIRRRATGQPIESIFRTESAVVFAEVQSDLVDIAAELGIGLLSAAECLVRNQLDKVVASGKDVLAGAVAEMFAPKKKTR